MKIAGKRLAFVGLCKLDCLTRIVSKPVQPKLENGETSASQFRLKQQSSVIADGKINILGAVEIALTLYMEGAKLRSANRLLTVCANANYNPADVLSSLLGNALLD